MTHTIEQLACESIALWQRWGAFLPPLCRQFTSAQQSRKESLLDQFVASLEGELLSAPLTRAERARTHARISAAFAEFARNALELEDRHLALLLHRGFPA